MTRHHQVRDEDRRIAEVVKHELIGYFSMKKNGDTWPAYIAKLVTPDRIVLITILIYQVGGQVQAFKTQVSGLADREQNLAAQHQVLDKQQQAQQRLIVEQNNALHDLKQETDTLMSENDKMRQLSARLNDQVRGFVTRSEFNSVLQQQIIPRLDRIEKTTPKEQGR